jgi:GNAT superfamily N-acetyltransferase
LFTVRDAHDEHAVAVLWLGMQGEPQHREAPSDQIEVVEKFRGRGYGRATIRARAEKARGLDAASMGLHVFGHSRVARSLYTSLLHRDRHDDVVTSQMT